MFNVWYWPHKKLNVWHSTNCLLSVVKKTHPEIQVKAFQIKYLIYLEFFSIWKKFNLNNSKNGTILHWNSVKNIFFCARVACMCVYASIPHSKVPFGDHDHRRFYRIFFFFCTSCYIDVKPILIYIYIFICDYESLNFIRIFYHFDYDWFLLIDWLILYVRVYVWNDFFHFFSFQLFAFAFRFFSFGTTHYQNSCLFISCLFMSLTYKSKKNY